MGYKPPNVWIRGSLPEMEEEMLIGILGRIGSGKGTVAERLVNTYGFRQDSFATTLKDATAVLFNWDRAMLEGDTQESRVEREKVDKWWSEKLGIENFTPRLALQLIGTDVFRNHFHQDIWMLSVMSRYKGDENVVISDARFPNEVNAVREMGGRIIRVDRGEEPIWWHHAIATCNGDMGAKGIMETTYSDIHASEWAWANTVPDEVILNNGTLDDLYGLVGLLNNKYKFTSWDDCIDDLF